MMMVGVFDVKPGGEQAPGWYYQVNLASPVGPFGTEKGARDALTIATIAQIVARAAEVAKRCDLPFNVTRAKLTMEVAHLTACPLELARMTEGRDFDVFHDVFGILRHWKGDGFGEGFWPRFAVRQ